MWEPVGEENLLQNEDISDIESTAGFVDFHFNI